MRDLRVRCVVLGVLSLFAGMYIAEEIPNGQELIVTHPDSYSSSVASEETTTRTSVAVATQVEHDDTPDLRDGIKPVVRPAQAIQSEPSHMHVATH